MAGFGDDLCMRRDPPGVAPLTADAIYQEEASAPFVARHAPNWNRRTCPDEQGHWTIPSPVRLEYQTRFNWFFSGFNAAEYYLLNLIRLTTLPFLHAFRSGYFIGFARPYPERRTGLLMMAIGVPTLLHGCYDAFGNSRSGLGFALLSVLALVLYLAKSVDFEKALSRQNPVQTELTQRRKDAKRQTE